MPYDRYPAVDENYLFPPEVREANSLSPEFRNQVVPLTQTQRNNLTGAELWDGRLILNKTTSRIDRYDLGTSQWIPMTSEPAGIIKEYGGSSAPAFHVLADGAVYPRDGIYAALFAVYGTTYNTGGELSTHFRVPNRKGRVAVGLDTGVPDFNALGKTGGAKSVALDLNTMPNHAHQGATGTQNANHQHGGSTDAQGDHAHATETNQIVPGTLNNGGTLVREGYVGIGSGRNTGGGGTHSHNVSTGSENAAHAHGIPAEGSGQPHENMPPFMVMNFIITL